MNVQKRQIEAEQFTGDNFDELKVFCPQLVKYTFRTKEDIENVQSSENFHGYTVGWDIPDAGPHEALPGFWIVKQNDKFRILEDYVFKDEFELS